MNRTCFLAAISTDFRSKLFQQDVNSSYGRSDAASFGDGISRGIFVAGELIPDHTTSCMIIRDPNK
jgi:hypothetical protein